MFIDFLFEVFRQNAESEAVIWHDQSFAYGKLLDWTNHWRAYLRKNRIAAGTVTAVEADFSPNAIALMLALIESGCIAVPLTSSVAAKKAEFMAIARVEALLELDARDEARLARFERPPTHEILQRLRERGHPGLILFSSGSTGESKAAVHDIVGMLGKFKVRRHARRAITFLLYDHIGGFNTMLYQLSNAGCIVTVQDRDPDTVLRAVERHKVELLPTSPTFINLILLSEAYRRYDLSSLKIVTYGTEPMPESTLRRFHQVLPHIELQQTYGLSEVGILRSKSRSSDSLWVKLGGEGFQTRVVDEILQIKAESAMLGYLNAPSPFTDDGWFNTGDKVEVDGDYFRILGRQSEIINVGGQKVYPAQVESVVQEMPEVAEVSVYGEKNVIMGQIVCAVIRLRESRDARQFHRELRQFCRQRLQEFQIPVQVRLVENAMHGERFKKNRRENVASWKFKPDTLVSVHEQMALVKAQSTRGFFTNYFRQEMVGPQILTAATARSVLLANDEHDFFRLYFFTSDLADLEQILRDVDFPGDVVASYLTKAADENIAAAFQQSGFNPIATYRRMITYRLPQQGPNPALEYAIAADVDELHEGLFQAFNKYTDHLPTKNRLHGYVLNQWVIVHRQTGRILGAVCFQLQGPRVNYNYLYNFSRNALDFLRLQNNFYGVMHQRGIRAGFLWINRTDTRLAALHESMGWRFDGLQDYFYLRSSVN
jgi:long-chain acyl-CoA synthetase